ncbi:hypothetical protein [Chitinophaga eiseniae]|uniref:hypothetical protein n=1 Tax=Chitinophaga eiseniae TaxID=634771 RepID=UPI0014556641|nr:hypothetical protein [Chitinophaga eiseniae]
MKKAGTIGYTNPRTFLDILYIKKDGALFGWRDIGTRENITSSGLRPQLTGGQQQQSGTT